MLASIRKFSKSFLAKIFIAIIALPFLLWGMGDIFTSGKQNVLVEINDEKINTQDFVNHLQKINLAQNQINSMDKSKLFDDILTNYISEKIIEYETNKKGINLSDQSLKKIIVNDKNLHKENKFSRVEYEKFLIKNGFTAPTYEKYLKVAEKKGQLLNYYSGGIKLPDFVINDLFKKENKSLEIEFINLNKLYSNNVIKENEIIKFYDENKNFFNEKFISFKYLQLLPKSISQKDEFDEDFFKKIDDIENQILDGKKFDQIFSKNNKNIKKVELINSRKLNRNGNLIEIPDDIFAKVFSLKKNDLEFISNNNNYYVVEILEDKNILLTLKDKDLKNTIKKQLDVKYKINENINFKNLIQSKKFDKNRMIKFANENGLSIEKITIENINDEKNFKLDLVKKIYNYNLGNIFVLTDAILKDNFIVNIKNEIYPKIKKDSEKYIKFKKKANSIYVTKIYKSYDRYINKNYKIQLNEKVLERLKNSF